jgi:hypothetical protein
MKRRIRISATGKKRIKIVCPAGSKSTGTKCVRMSSSEKLNRKKGIRFAVRTKKASSGKQKMAVRAMKRAMKKRKARGL